MPDHVPEDRLAADLHERLRDLGRALLQPRRRGRRRGSRPSRGEGGGSEARHLRQATRHGSRRTVPPGGRVRERPERDRGPRAGRARGACWTSAARPAGWRPRSSGAARSRSSGSSASRPTRPRRASTATASWRATCRSSRTASGASTASWPPTCWSTSWTRGARSRATWRCWTPAAGRSCRCPTRPSGPPSPALAAVQGERLNASMRAPRAAARLDRQASRGTRARRRLVAAQLDQRSRNATLGGAYPQLALGAGSRPSANFSVREVAELARHATGREQRSSYRDPVGRREGSHDAHEAARGGWRRPAQGLALRAGSRGRRGRSR